MYENQYQFANGLDKQTTSLTGYGWHVSRTLPAELAYQRDPPRPAVAIKTLWSAITAGLDRIRQHLRRRAARRELYALNDRVLNDIGLPRHLIDAVVNEVIDREGDTDRAVHSVAAVLRRVNEGAVSANDEVEKIAGCG